MPKVIFSSAGKSLREVSADDGASILEVALASRINLYHTCGGNASCSTCRIRVVQGADNLSGIDDAEAQVLDSFDLKPPFRLGCQTRLLGGDVEIEIPEWERAPRPNKTPQVP